MIVLGSLMVKRPTDTTTVGLRLQLHHLNAPPFLCLSVDLSFSSYSERGDNSRFGWVLSSFFLSLSLFPCFFVYQTIFSVSLFTVSPPVHPSMPVFKVHLLPFSSPSFILHRLQISFQQCHTRTCSHKGRRSICVTNGATPMRRIYI